MLRTTATLEFTFVIDSAGRVFYGLIGAGQRVEHAVIRCVRTLVVYGLEYTCQGRRPAGGRSDGHERVRVATKILVRRHEGGELRAIVFLDIRIVRVDVLLLVVVFVRAADAVRFLRLDTRATQVDRMNFFDNCVNTNKDNK